MKLRLILFFLTTEGHPFYPAHPVNFTCKATCLRLMRMPAYPAIFTCKTTCLGVDVPIFS